MRLLKSVRSQLGNYHLKSAFIILSKRVQTGHRVFRQGPAEPGEARRSGSEGMTRYYLTQTHITAGDLAEEEGDLPGHPVRRRRARRLPEYLISLPIGLLRVRLGELTRRWRSRKPSFTRPT
jgi:hypothetical protein